MSRIYGYISNNKIEENILPDNIKYLNDENVVVSLDGEIENKDELCIKFNMKTNLETKLIENLYFKFGENFVYEIEGFFAIALYDKKEKKLILVRDKIGQKPLYYYIKNKSICFSSELKQIIKNPDFEKKINNDALSMYFRFTYINPPETIFKDTYKLEHGHYVVWKEGKVENKIYWNAIEKFNKFSKKKVLNLKIAKINIKKMLYEYIEKIIKNTDDFGVYLSGGIDSSLITAITKDIYKKPINTFSIGFYEEERNEAKKAKKIANYLKTNHHEFYIDESELLKIIKKIPKYYDEPFADASEIPTIILNEFAKKNGVKIAITGDGADQLFCGSKIYDRLVREQKKYIIKKFIKRKIYSKVNKKNKTQVEIFTRENEFEGLFKDTGEKRYNFEDKIKTTSWQVKRMIVDVNTFVANRLNTKTDRPSSANGITIKTPFLQNKLIEYSFRIPQKYKYYKKNKKYILKQILYEYVPKELLSQNKQGFGIPIKKWLSTYLYDDLIRVSEKNFIEKQNIFNYEKLMELIEKIKDKNYSENFAQILWNFYVFQLWYIEYIQN